MVGIETQYKSGDEASDSGGLSLEYPVINGIEANHLLNLLSRMLSGVLIYNDSGMVIECAGSIFDSGPINQMDFTSPHISKEMLLSLIGISWSYDQGTSDDDTKEVGFPGNVYQEPVGGVQRPIELQSNFSPSKVIWRKGTDFEENIEILSISLGEDKNALLIPDITASSAIISQTLESQFKISKLLEWKKSTEMTVDELEDKLKFLRDSLDSAVLGFQAGDEEKLKNSLSVIEERTKEIELKVLRALGNVEREMVEHLGLEEEIVVEQHPTPTTTDHVSEVRSCLSRYIPDERTIRSLVQGYSDSIIFIARESGTGAHFVVDANDRFNRLVGAGISRAEILGQPLQSYVGKIPNNHDAQIRQMSEETYRTMGQRRMEVLFSNGRGDKLDVNIGLMKVFSEKLDDIIGIGVIRLSEKGNILVHNRHKLSELQLSLFETQKVFAGVNHDLRNPVAGMLLTISFLNSIIDSSELYNLDETRVRSMIGSRISKMSNYINSSVKMLERCRQIFDGVVHRDTMNIEEIDICSLLGRSIELVSEAKTRDNIFLIVSDQLLESTSSLYTDGLVLGRIFENLISNAVKYSNEQYPVNVFLMNSEGPDHQINTKVIIEDFGNGMSPEELERAQKIFTRLPEGAATSEGFGLGLPIVSEFCELLGIKVNFDSIKGRGTRVELVIPRTIS